MSLRMCIKTLPVNRDFDWNRRIGEIHWDQLVSHMCILNGDPVDRSIDHYPLTIDFPLILRRSRTGKEYRSPDGVRRTRR